MKTYLLLLVLLFTTGVHQQALAQDDQPWWKKLFRKETVDEMDEPKSDDGEMVTPRLEDSTPDTVETDELPGEVRPAFSDRPGQINVSLPAGFERLDSAFREQPPALNGFRVQVYFGNLNGAREHRSTYIGEDHPYPAYLVQNPPNFAVQIGDFRDQLEAHRVLRHLKETYPSAIVVPSEIEWPPVEPVRLEEDEE